MDITCRKSFFVYCTGDMFFNEILNLPSILWIPSCGVFTGTVTAQLNVCFPSVLVWLVSVLLLLTILYLGQCGPLRL